MNTEKLNEQNLRDKANFAGGYAAGLITSPVFWVVEGIAFTAGAAGSALTYISEALERKPEAEAVDAEEAPAPSEKEAAGATA